MSFDLKLANRDLVLNNGDFQQVVDGDKLLQDVLKAALTDAGSDPMNPWYGSNISRALIGSALPAGISLQMAQSQLQNCLETIKNLQSAQMQNGQKVSADELLAAVMDVSINRNNVDPRIFDVFIKILTKGFKTINTGFTVSNI